MLSKETRKLMNAVDELREVDREMPMSRLHVLLCVEEQNEEGALVRRIIAKTGMNQSTVARNLDALRGQSGRGRQHKGLVEGVPDHEDPRMHRYFLTAEGKKVLRTLSRILA